MQSSKHQSSSSSSTSGPSAKTPNKQPNANHVAVDDEELLLTTLSINVRCSDVLIKEENLPPGKWALGRIQDVHPGKDNYVRVVSLKTKGDNIIKRPVNKLVLLPTNEDTAQDQAIDQGNSSNPSPPSSCQQKE
ncbi:hypothetical protein HF086_007385 [Spodoptera exigua]|uniref:DUF5641 domain-containing protein n=1 Tax=Spodoptera exigua TaxID=7107 RepID=A0A922SG18_SPOEX|nr:hypothetical protein HF086_007385 [Spodoptera exigua]